MGDKNLLLTPIKLGNRTLENRFALNAMECNDADEHGNPTKRTYERYSRYFEGNAGLIDLEAITVTYESRGRLMQLSVEPHNQKALAAFVKEMKRINDKPLFVWQITHSGELSDPTFSRRVTVKPLPGYENADLLSEEEVDGIIDKFVLGAKIAHDCGADGLDIKLCHGYLVTQILRPYNDRKWKYGGQWENRRRFAFELYERITKEVNDPNFILGSKITIWEGIPGGFGTEGPKSPIMDLTEPLDLIKGIEERGAKYILVSAGNPSLTLALSQPDLKIPDYAYLHHYFQKQVKKHVKPDTVVIGSAYSIFRDGHNNFQGVKKPEESSLFYWGDKNIKEGVVDMVAVGRQTLADPQIPKKLAEGHENEIKWCTACDNCIEFLIRQKNVGCATHEKEFAKALLKIRKEEEALKEKHT